MAKEITNTRCNRDLCMFIDFMNANQDLRFWQGVRAFTGKAFVLTATKRNDLTDEFEGIKDTYYDEKI